MIRREVNVVKDSKMINPNDYDVVICVDGKAGRLFEYGKETTRYLRKVELSHEAGSRAELTVTRHVASKEVIEHIENT